MKSTITFMTTTLALLLTASVGAQTTVYETRDAEGNASFSDESSPDSEKVEIQATTIVDAPQPMPREQAEENAELGEAPAQQPGENGVEYVGDGGGDYLDDDPRLHRDADYYRRKELTPGVTPLEEDRRVMEDTGTPGEDAVGRADEAAERSDITGPNAEYRNTEHVEHRGGGGRR